MHLMDRFIRSAIATGIATVLLLTAACGGQPAASDTALAQGKVLFVRCASCHAATAGAPTKIGPNLDGVVGRKGGSLAGYHYSPAMQANGPVWTEENLDRWLTGPEKVVPGTSMAFAGLPDPAERKALIAYLKTLR